MCTATGWYAPRWQYVQPTEARLASGCDVALSHCSDYNARYPGTYYCTLPPAGSNISATAAAPCFSPLSVSACDVTPFSDGCGVLRAGWRCKDDSWLQAAYGSSKDQNGAAPGYYFGFGYYYGPAARCLPYSSATVAKRPGCFQMGYDSSAYGGGGDSSDSSYSGDGWEEGLADAAKDVMVGSFCMCFCGLFLMLFLGATDGLVPVLRALWRAGLSQTSASPGAPVITLPLLFSTCCSCPQHPPPLSPQHPACSNTKHTNTRFTQFHTCSTQCPTKPTPLFATSQVKLGVAGSIGLQCPAGAQLLLESWTHIKGLSIECPATDWAAITMALSLNVGCYGGCVHGDCLPSGECACKLAWMGSACDVHVNDVLNFDDPDGTLPSDDSGDYWYNDDSGSYDWYDDSGSDWTGGDSASDGDGHYSSSSSSAGGGGSSGSSSSDSWSDSSSSDVDQGGSKGTGGAAVVGGNHSSSSSPCPTPLPIATSSSGSSSSGSSGSSGAESTSSSGSSSSGGSGSGLHGNGTGDAQGTGSSGPSGATGAGLGGSSGSSSPSPSTGGSSGGKGSSSSKGSGSTVHTSVAHTSSDNTPAGGEEEEAGGASSIGASGSSGTSGSGDGDTSSHQGPTEHDSNQPQDGSGDGAVGALGSGDPASEGDGTRGEHGRMPLPPPCTTNATNATGPCYGGAPGTAPGDQHSSDHGLGSGNTHDDHDGSWEGEGRPAQRSGSSGGWLSGDGSGSGWGEDGPLAGASGSSAAGPKTGSGGAPDPAATATLLRGGAGENEGADGASGSGTLVDTGAGGAEAGSGGVGAAAAPQLLNSWSTGPTAQSVAALTSGLVTTATIDGSTIDSGATASATANTGGSSASAEREPVMDLALLLGSSASSSGGSSSSSSKYGELAWGTGTGGAPTRQVVVVSETSAQQADISGKLGSSSTGSSSSTPDAITQLLQPVVEEVAAALAAMRARGGRGGGGHVAHVLEGGDSGGGDPQEG